MQEIEEEFYNREVLERLGVPSRAIRVLGEGVLNTVQELQLVAGEVSRVGGKRVSDRALRHGEPLRAGPLVAQHA